jgi:hypothetical protein
MFVFVELGWTVVRAFPSFLFLMLSQRAGSLSSRLEASPIPITLSEMRPLKENGYSIKLPHMWTVIVGQ